MDNLLPYFSLLSQFDHNNIIALDRCHNLFLIGALLSKKPENVLELGIGTGYVSWSLLYGLKYNGKGKLTCVDNWFDWGGKEPKGVENLRKEGVKVIAPISEEEFVKNCPSDEYDFLISDADHFNSGKWIDEHLRITKHDGLMFFHNTNQPNLFPSLQLIETRLKELNLPYYHFKENSRSDEHCDRGWLFAINKKDVPPIELSPSLEYTKEELIKKSDSLRIKPNNYEYDFLHPKSIYIKNVILSIFQGNEYPIIRLPNYSPTNIVDVGANVGATAVYFHNFYPSAKIYCYEPSRENFQYLKENTKYFQNIQVFPYGLFDRDCELPLYQGSSQTAENSVMKSNYTTNISEPVRLVKAFQEMKRRNLKYISILKLDTEGCEVPILSQILLFVEQIDIMYIEYHSEEDRREIEEIVSAKFVLFKAKAEEIHQGTCVYLSKTLVQRYPEMERKKIQRIDL